MIENPAHNAAATPPKKPLPKTSRAKRLAQQARLKSRKAMGRPSTISPAIVNQIVTLLQNGIAVEVTCAAVGINTSTFYNWMKRGGACSEGLYKDFFDGVERAYAICEINMVATVRKHADTDPTTARWLLSTRFPDRWAPIQKSAIMTKAEITTQDGTVALPQAPIIVVNMPQLIDTPRLPARALAIAQEAETQPPGNG